MRAKIMTTIRLISASVFVLAVAAGGVETARAGSLTPPGVPESTMHSLGDIAGTGFSTAVHSLKKLYDFMADHLEAPMTGTAYDSSTIDADADGNIMERLEFIQRNIGGYAFGSADADDVLMVAGGAYSAVNLTPANVRDGVAFGVGTGSQTGTYGGGGWAYGSDDATKVLASADAPGTFSAANLSVATVKAGTAFGVGLTGDYPSNANPLSGDTAATDATVSTICTGKEAWTKSGALLSGSLDPAAAAIGTGNSYCGISGTLLGNQFSGTFTGFPGGSQANGGADDYNNGGTPASGRYATGWTTCVVGNNYCGTGLTSADAKDDATGMIWSLPCNGSGCGSFSDASPVTYSWDASGGNNASKTASQLCTAGTHGQSGWALPHQKQLMQAYVDGSYGNLEAVGTGRGHWSATTVSTNTTNAWYTYLSYGTTLTSAKTTANYVRCVRLAN